MGVFSDNFYSWLEKEYAAEKAAMETIVSDEWKSEDHPRGNPKNKGQFRKSEKTIEKENKEVGEEDDLSDSGDKKKESEATSPTAKNGGGVNGNGQGQKVPPKSINQPNTPKTTQSIGGPKFLDATPEEFAKAISAAKKQCSSENAWRVDAYPASHYKDSKARIVTQKGSCIAVQANGDMISLCRSANEDDDVKGYMLMKEAIRRDGDRCDTFEGNFNRYVRNGMMPVSWIRWNPDPDIRPSDWKEGENEPEDVIFFMYTGHNELIDKDKWKETHPPIEGDNCYDRAMQIRDDALAEFKKNHPEVFRH